MSNHKLWSYSILEVAKAVVEEKALRSYAESAFAMAEHLVVEACPCGVLLSKDCIYAKGACPVHK